jgi:hypothetical protein
MSVAFIRFMNVVFMNINGGTIAVVAVRSARNQSCLPHLQSVQLVGWTRNSFYKVWRMRLCPG